LPPGKRGELAHESNLRRGQTGFSSEEFQRFKLRSGILRCQFARFRRRPRVPSGDKRPYVLAGGVACEPNYRSAYWRAEWAPKCPLPNAENEKVPLSFSNLCRTVNTHQSCAARALTSNRRRWSHESRRESTPRRPKAKQPQIEAATSSRAPWRFSNYSGFARPTIRSGDGDPWLTDVSHPAYSTK
jgi:hypothetical protein